MQKYPKRFIKVVIALAFVVAIGLIYGYFCFCTFSIQIDELENYLGILSARKAARGNKIEP